MVVFLSLVSTLLAGLVLLHAPRLRVGALAWVCLSSCFIWPLANNYLSLHYGAEVYPSSRSAAAASAAAAGGQWLGWGGDQCLAAVGAPFSKPVIMPAQLKQLNAKRCSLSLQARRCVPSPTSSSSSRWDGPQPSGEWQLLHPAHQSVN